MVNLSFDNLPEGQIIDGFQILGPLGVGGMGAVYRASQLTVERLVALKVLNPALANEQRWRKRFLQEGRICAGLEHEGIVKCFAFGIWLDRVPYLVFELVPGITLRSLLNDSGALPLDQTIRIGLSLCSALAYAHSYGVIHRDLKPENIMIVPETKSIKILDFGVATICSADKFEVQKLTQTGAAIGTLGYVSPEELAGDPVDQRSDIYSLGCVLVECLLGQQPPIESTPESAMIGVKQFGKIRTSKQMDDFLCVLLKLLEPTPQARYATMNQLHDDLELILQGREFEHLCADEHSRYLGRLRTARSSKVNAKALQTVLLCMAFTATVVFGYAPIAQCGALMFESLGGPKAPSSLEYVGDACSHLNLLSLAVLNYKISKTLTPESAEPVEVARILCKLADAESQQGNYQSACSYSYKAIRSLLKVRQSKANETELRKLLAQCWSLVLKHASASNPVDLELFDQTASLPAIKKHEPSAWLFALLRIRMVGATGRAGDASRSAILTANSMANRGRLPEALMAVSVGLEISSSSSSSSSSKMRVAEQVELLSMQIRLASKLTKQDPSKQAAVLTALTALEPLLLDSKSLERRQRNRVILDVGNCVGGLGLSDRLTSLVSKGRQLAATLSPKDFDLTVVLDNLETFVALTKADNANALALESKRNWDQLHRVSDPELRRSLIAMAGPGLLQSYAQLPQSSVELQPAQIDTIKSECAAESSSEIAVASDVLADFALSRIMRKRGDVERGIQLIEQGLSKTRNKFGPAYAAEVAVTYNELLLGEGQTKGAENFIGRQIDIASKCSVKGPPLAQLYIARAKVELRSKRPSEAKDSIARARHAVDNFESAAESLAINRSIELISKELLSQSAR